MGCDRWYAKRCPVALDRDTGDRTARTVATAPLMSLDMIGHAKGQAQMVLGIGSAIRKAGANVVRLERPDGDGFGDRHVPAAAHLQREGVGARGNARGGREKAVAGVGAPKQLLDEQAVFMPGAQMEGIARPGHQGDLVQVDGGRDIPGMVVGEIRGRAETVEKVNSGVGAPTPHPEALAGDEVRSFGGKGERKVGGHAKSADKSSFRLC